MPVQDESSDEDEFRDEEFPDQDAGRGSSTVACPNCRKPVFDDADRCPSCGDWIVPGSEPPQREIIPWWVVVALLLAGTLVIGMLLGR